MSPRRPRANLHVYPSDLAHASRLLKETKSLADAGLFDRIYIGGIWRPGLPEHERLDEVRHVWRVPLQTAALPDGAFWKSLKLLEWSARIYLRYRDEGVACVNCHRLSVLPLGVLFKLLRRAVVVYDTHELETETQMGRVRRWLSRLVERLLIGHASAVIVVSDSIGEWYRGRYGLSNLRVVRNVPYRRRLECEGGRVLKEKFGIAHDDILFVHQGALGGGRGIEILLRAFARVDGRKHIAFMGFGELEDMVREYTRRYSNIHFHPAVSPEEVVRYTGSADVGIYVIENVCLSYYYSLPNKLFECLLAGLPFIASDFPEMRRIVEATGCGWTVPVDEDAVVGLLSKLGRPEIEQRRQNARRCRATFSWEEEEKKFLPVYQGLLEAACSRSSR